METVDFRGQVTAPLVRVAHQLVDASEFVLLESVANLLAAVKSGRWEQVACDEQVFWLERLCSSLVRYAADTGRERDEALDGAVTILAAQERALRRRL